MDRPDRGAGGAARRLAPPCSRRRAPGGAAGRHPTGRHGGRGDRHGPGARTLRPADHLAVLDGDDRAQPAAPLLRARPPVRPTARRGSPRRRHRERRVPVGHLRRHAPLPRAARCPRRPPATRHAGERAGARRPHRWEPGHAPPLRGARRDRRPRRAHRGDRPPGAAGAVRPGDPAVPAPRLGAQPAPRVDHRRDAQAGRLRRERRARVPRAGVPRRVAHRRVPRVQPDPRLRRERDADVLRRHLPPGGQHGRGRHPPTRTRS